MKTKYIIIFLLIISTYFNFSVAFCQETDATEVTMAEKFSDDFKKTKITPVMDELINTSENLIFCSTFQSVWNEICNKYAEGTLEINDAPNFVDKLNNLYEQEPLVDEKSFIALSGFGGEKINQKINDAIKLMYINKKNNKKPPVFDFVVGSNEIIAFSYLYKNLKYPSVFENLKPIVMKNQNRNFYASAFGIDGGHEKQKLYKQVKIYYFNDATEEVNRPKGIILGLITNSETDELVISTIPASKTLFDTYGKIQNLIDINSESAFIPNQVEDQIKNIDPNKPEKTFTVDVLKIPKINFNIIHSYKELILKEILNKPLKKYVANTYIIEALQKINFKLDEKGAEIESYSEMEIGCASRPKSIIVCCPFIIYLKNITKKSPYFMAYIANEELLVKFDANDNESYFSEKDKLYLLDNKIINSILDGESIDELQKIIANGYDINTKSKDGTTALLLLFKNRNNIFSAIYNKYFEQAKVDHDVLRNIVGKTEKSYLDLITFLLSNNADINSTDSDGKNILMIAEENGQSEIAEMLINKGIDINVKDKNGNTPLIYSFKNVHRRIIKLLIDKGADVTAKNKDGKDPLSLAESQNLKDIVELINSKKK